MDEHVNILTYILLKLLKTAISVVTCRAVLFILKINFLSTTETKIAEFANSVDLDEVAHNEPPHLDLHCCPLVFELSI